MINKKNKSDCINFYILLMAITIMACGTKEKSSTSSLTADEFADNNPSKFNYSENHSISEGVYKLTKLSIESEEQGTFPVYLQSGEYNAEINHSSVKESYKAKFYGRQIYQVEGQVYPLGCNGEQHTQFSLNSEFQVIDGEIIRNDCQNTYLNGLQVQYQYFSPNSNGFLHLIIATINNSDIVTYYYYYTKK